MPVLVIAEHDNRALGGATARVVTAAAAFGEGVEVLVAGQDCTTAANEAAGIAGVHRVLTADGPTLGDFLAEPLAALVAEIAPRYAAVLAPANTFGKNVLPRVAGLMNVALVSDVIEIKSADTFVRPIYAGNALATIRNTDPVKLVTVRPTVFEAAHLSDDKAGVEAIAPPPAWTRTRLVSRAHTSSERPDLASARIVIAGGRGMRTKENFAILERIADKLGAAVGATRAAVDAGFVANDLQVGQTGKVVAPELYIAAGISGAIQHVAGIKDSRVIVAINTDENAPIFEVADYALVADVEVALPKLEAALSGIKADG